MEEYLVKIKDSRNFQCIYERNGRKQRVEWRSDHDCTIDEAFKIIIKAIKKCDSIGYDERMPGYEFQL